MINFMNKLLNALGIGVADDQVDDSFESVSMETLKDRHSHLLRTQILMVGRQGVHFSQTVLEAATLIQQAVTQASS